MTCDYSNGIQCIKGTNLKLKAWQGYEKAHIDGNASKPHIMSFDETEIFTEIYF